MTDSVPPLVRWFVGYLPRIKRKRLRVSSVNFSAPENKLCSFEQKCVQNLKRVSVLPQLVLSGGQTGHMVGTVANHNLVAMNIQTKIKDICGSCQK